MVIRILGIGCPACHRMEEDVRKILRDFGLEARVERITDPEAIRRYQVFSIPALVIEDQLVMAGYRGKGSIERVILDQISP